MITRLKLLRNIGLFDSVSVGPNLSLARLTLIYAENGRGKTTLAAILRSLATGNPLPIGERRRLAAVHPPHVVIECDGGPPATAIFRSNAWNRTAPNMAVFDDIFVDSNIYSGLVVGPEHRQNLHELILGAQAVALNQQLQQSIERIETHNAELRVKAAAIPIAERGAFSVDDFCALQHRADIEEALQTTERNLAAAHEQDPIRNTPLFDPLNLPGFELAKIDDVLQENLESLDAVAAARIQTHLTAIGSDGETWISEGMGYLRKTSSDATPPICPFCAQNLSGSTLINHYRAYFSAEYADLKRRVSQVTAEVNKIHSGDLAASFERAIRVAIERRQFWSRFSDVPEISIDTAGIVRDWRDAQDAIIQSLTAKQAAPLERIVLSLQVRARVQAYETHRQAVSSLNDELQRVNSSLLVVKEQAAASNPSAIAADLARLKAVKARYTPRIAALCDAYLQEKTAKAQTEQQRDQARTHLEQHRTNVFAGYQTAVNLYLQRFNAGFRLERVTYSNTRGGPAL